MTAPPPFAPPPSDHEPIFEETAREWWLWYFAAHIAAGYCANPEFSACNPGQHAERAAAVARALVIAMETE